MFLKFKNLLLITLLGILVNTSNLFAQDWLNTNLLQCQKYYDLFYNCKLTQEKSLIAGFDLKDFSNETIVTPQIAVIELTHKCPKKLDIYIKSETETKELSPSTQSQILEITSIGNISLKQKSTKTTEVKYHQKECELIFHSVKFSPTSTGIKHISEKLAQHKEKLSLLKKFKEKINSIEITLTYLRTIQNKDKDSIQFDTSKEDFKKILEGKPIASQLELWAAYYRMKNADTNFMNSIWSEETNQLSKETNKESLSELVIRYEKQIKNTQENIDKLEEYLRLWNINHEK